MKKIIKELKKVRKEIKHVKECLIGIDKSSYYIFFGDEKERNEDKTEHFKELKVLLCQEFTILENLKLACEKEKVKNSYKCRNLILEINGK